MDDRPNDRDGFTPQPAVSASSDLAGPSPATSDVPAVSASSGNVFTRFFTSHPTGFWFFFWGELAERSCFYGMRAILVLYLAEELTFGKNNASTIYHLFVAACYFLPLLGGYVADNYFGKYWTIVGFSLPYILGQLCLCFDSSQILGVRSDYFVFVSLVLLAMGSGVIKPNISTLMGLTYDQHRPGKTQLRSDAFSFFYMAINIGAFLSSFLMPTLRTRYGYHIAFLCPAVLMVVALALFALGKPFYAREVITRVQSSPEERREQWLVLRRLGGLFLVFIPFWMIFDQSSSTWILFAKESFNLNLGFKLPFIGDKLDPDQFQFLNPLLIIVLLPFISVGLWRLLARAGIRMRPTDKMLVGFVLTTASMGVMVIAGVLAEQGNKVSIWWQVGTFFLITAAELCISPVGLELAFTAAPRAMKGFITGCFLLMVFFGNLLDAVVTRLYTPLGPAAYFGTMTTLLILVSLVFVFVARRFNRIMEEHAAVPVGAGDKFAPQPTVSEEIQKGDQYSLPESRMQQ
ncbi:MAG TPA: oligopeptide:H+ symporter [Gemmataceae bacterium]|nr:oligopeptide:H+ symporter [Gemmataceae bacterium]